MYRLHLVPREGEYTSYNRVLLCLLEAENVPEDQDFAERGRMYHLHSGRKREITNYDRTSNNTQSLSKRENVPLQSRSAAENKTSESDNTPQQQDSAQRASVIKAHNLQ